ncbi:MAG: hypothetical protein NZM09_09895 [Ignavibacterium sp.]|nr:hypothetical protein [Ignavibacterium sp.]MDW8375989.1 hypothetical protein [Ignavibacteriales bacterium]
MNWEGIVSLLIACIEFLLILNLLVFVDKNKINLLIISLITFLMTYQLFEFIICNLGYNDSLYVYLAFFTITFIPTINLALINRILFNYPKLELKLLELLFTFFAFSLLFFYGMNYRVFEVKKCTVLYATFNYPLGFLYGFYYYLPIIISFVLLMYRIKYSQDISFKKKLKILLFGHFFIILPPTFGFILNFLGYSKLIDSIESILCKFALFYALTISFFAIYNSKYKDERNYLKYLSGYK